MSADLTGQLGTRVRKWLAERISALQEGQPTLPGKATPDQQANAELANLKRREEVLILEALQRAIGEELPF